MRLVNEILALRQQADIRDRWLRRRLDTIIPELLVRENVDMWIIACREYNEDPVLMSMLPATSLSCSTPHDADLLARRGRISAAADLVALRLRRSLRDGLGSQ